MTKKIMSIIMALALVLTMTTVAFAAGDGVIEIKNTIKDQTYTIYKLFDQTADLTNGSFAYTIDENDVWYDFFNTGGDGAQFVTITQKAEGYYAITIDENTDVKPLAAKAIAYAEANSITPAATAQTANADGAQIKFENLDYGYYLVDSSLGALCALNSTHNTVEIVEKNSIPSIDKNVQEDSTDAYGKVNDAEIGETVTFQTTINIGTGAKDLTVHDTMDAGLTYVGVQSVKVAGTNADFTAYTVNDATTDGCTFELSIAAADLEGLAENTQLIVTYTATVNENAIIRGENKNTVYLTYGDNQTPTEEVETNTNVWDFKVKKISDKGAVLANAQFELYAEIEGQKVKMNFTETATADEYLLNGSGAVATMTTDADGTITLKGLDSGTYYLRETEAPDGYNLLANDVKIVIDANGKVFVDDATEEDTDMIVEVENKAGGLLPSTGGIGTTLFYVLGGTLFVAAFALLVLKKRTGEAQ